MKIEELGLKISDVMQLQIADNVHQRYPVRLYGYNPTGSIIVSAPKSPENKMITLRESSMVTLRFVANNVASAFTCKLLSTSWKPYPHLHLEIPTEIQTVEVRNGVQAATDLSVSVLNKTKQTPAVLARFTVISDNYVRMESNKIFAGEDDIISVTSMLKVKELERMLTMDCKVTDVKEKSKNEIFVYDLKIKNIDEDDALLLHFYVYQELLRNLHMV